MDISQARIAAEFVAFVDVNKPRALRTRVVEILHACADCKNPPTSMLAFYIDRLYGLQRIEDRKELLRRNDHHWCPSDLMPYNSWPRESCACVQTATQCTAVGEAVTKDFEMEMAKYFLYHKKTSDRKATCRSLSAEKPCNLNAFSDYFKSGAGLSTEEYLSKNWQHGFGLLAQYCIDRASEQDQARLLLYIFQDLLVKQPDVKWLPDYSPRPFRPTKDYVFKSMIIVLLARICHRKELTPVSEKFYRISNISLESNIILLSEELWKVMLGHYNFEEDEAGKLQCPFKNCNHKYHERKDMGGHLASGRHGQCGDLLGAQDV